MDYLYDKVDLYDKLKEVIQGKSLPDPITDIQNRFQDIEHNLLHFLDNHDEQRLASDAFAGTAEKGMPLMVLSATISSSPTMIYFGQEVGERGDLDSGFGKPTRTTIFDYASVPAHWRWMNYGRFDGGALTENEKKLRDFYKRLLNFTLESEALMGNFMELQTENRKQGESYKPGLYSFARYSKNQKLIVVNNFSWVSEADFTLQIPESLIKTWKLKNGSYPLTEKLYGSNNAVLVVKDGKGTIALKLAPSESFILEVGK
jgi:glycosidase